MTGTSYDDHILQHYRGEAEGKGLSEVSTMEDRRIRQLETEFILRGLEQVLGARQDVRICDAGCGNGYTLSRIRLKYSDANLTGVEFTPELRNLAKSRFSDDPRAKIEAGDIRRSLPLKQPADVVITQRVLINLLEAADQMTGFQRLIDATMIGGHLIVIEAFQNNLQLLNEARAEFELPPIPAANHNLYLGEDFFSAFKRIQRVELPGASEHFLSTHYFVARVFHAALFAGKPFIRNSHFVRFFSEALNSPVGTYSPLRGFVFKRIS